MANDEMRQIWVGGAAGWVANEAVFDALYAPATAAILGAAAPAPGLHVLDVGCGSGTLLAGAAAAGATATGVDNSPAMVEAARNRVPAAHVVLDDVQTTDWADVPGKPFHRVVSRFGVMFFADPVAAFANLRSVTAPGGRTAFVCWRGQEENPAFTLGTSVLLDRMDPRPQPPGPGAPGPMSFADAGRVGTVLRGAGWSDIEVEPLDFVCDYGFAGTDGVEERITVVLGTAAGRLARAQLEPELGEQGWNSLVDDARAAIRDRMDGAPQLRHPAATWLVTASRS